MCVCIRKRDNTRINEGELKMKKYVLSLLFIVVLAMSISAVQEKQRYLVKSDSNVLKSTFGVKHTFNLGFTTDLTAGQVEYLKKIGIAVEEVPQYEISDKTNGKPAPTVCKPTSINGIPWGVAMVNGGIGGNATVAVLDTGIVNHPDLTNSVIDCKDFTKGVISNTCVDGNGHGTHVSGTIAAHGKIVGVAPNTKLMEYKVCNNRGSCSSDDIAVGIRTAADKGANIISMSFGGMTETQWVKDAISYAAAHNVLLVAASGNSGGSEKSPAPGITPLFNYTINYPAADPNVIAVGAIDSDRNLAYFSSTGIDDGNDSVISEKEIEFVAPGVNVESTLNDGCYAIWSGTSMATPHVSGLASKLWTGNATATRANLRGIAHNVNGQLWDRTTGYGLPVAN